MIYLFDFDDTLIDTKIYAEMYPEIMQAIQKKYPTINEIAKKNNVTINKFGRYDSGELAKKLDMLDTYYEILGKHIDTMPVLKKNVIETLKKLKGNRIGIVSNSMKRTINTYLQKYNIEKYFDFIYSVDDSSCKKNDINYWQGLIKKYKINPNDCIIIGDNEIDDKLIPNKLGFNTFIIKDISDFKKIN